ncbi:MAG: DNA-binding transcriptional MerR regulator [Sphingobacteriales bacterium]
MKSFSIKDIESLTGIKSHTLRVWETRYNFITPKRTETNIRYYTEEDLRKLMNVALLNQHGFKLCNLADLDDCDINKHVEEICDDCHKHDGQLQTLYMAMINFDEQAIDKVITTNIVRLGMKETMLQLVFPLMNKIGMMWQAACICPAHEYFVTNIIKQKLNVASDAQYHVENPNSKRFLLFLPEGENHELSLLFANYLLKIHGHKVLYLGQSQPIKDLESVAKTFRPDFLLSVVTSPLVAGSLEKFIEKICASFKNQQILLTGFQVINQGIEGVGNLRVLESPDDLLDLLADYKPAKELV